MKRKEVRPVTKHTLNLFAGQIERLQSLYPRKGAAYAIRRVIDIHLAQIEARTATIVPDLEINADVEDIV